MRSDDVLTFAVESKHFDRQPPVGRHVRAEDVLYAFPYYGLAAGRLWDVNEYCKSHCYRHVMRWSRQRGTYNGYTYTPLPPDKSRSTTLKLGFSLFLYLFRRSLSPDKSRIFMLIGRCDLPPNVLALVLTNVMFIAWRVEEKCKKFPVTFICAAEGIPRRILFLWGLDIPPAPI